MSSGLIFLFLTALLLVQCSVGKPAPDDDTAADVSKEEETKKECKSMGSSHSTSEEEREALAELLLHDEFIKISDLIYTSGKKLIEDVVADVNAMEDKSEALIAKTGQLTAFIKKLEKIDSAAKDSPIPKLAFIVGFDDMLDKFNTTQSAENSIIEASFNKHGIHKILEDLKVKFLEFTEKYYVAADKFWDSLCPEVQAKNKKFAEWLKLSKKEKGATEKIVLFLEIYDISEKSE